MIFLSVKTEGPVLIFETTMLFQALTKMCIEEPEDPFIWLAKVNSRATCKIIRSHD